MKQARLEQLERQGYYDEPDALTGGATAIGRIGGGYRSPSGHDGAPARGSDFPAAARSLHARSLGRLAEVAGVLRQSGESKTGLELIGALLGRYSTKVCPELEAELAELRKSIPVVRPAAGLFTRTKPLTSGQTSAVYVDSVTQSAYKLVAVGRDGRVGGFLPGAINERSDGSLSIRGEKGIPVEKLIKAIALANAHGSPVYTELAGITEDGHLVIKQPYIKGVTILDYLDHPKEAAEALHKLGLLKLTDIGSLAAVGRNADGATVLFDDIHGRNLMVDKEGKPYFVDALATRPLTDHEVDRISPKLKAEPQPLSEAARP